MKNEKEPQETQQLVGHFWDSLVKNAESKSPPSGHHAYNNRTKGSIGTPRSSSSNTTKVNSPQTVKQSLPIQNTQKLALQYDIIEDLKKIRANISMHDLLQIYPMPNGPICQRYGSN